MENKIFKNNEETKTSSIILNNQTNLTLTGVQEVYSTNEKILILKVSGKKLTITGDNINITKLNVDTGEMEAKGIFDSIKFTNNTNLFKRIFK